MKITIKKRLMTVMLAMIMVLSSMTGLVSATDISDFKDVPTSAWYYDNVKYAVEHGMVSGTSADAFSPESNITRGQFIAIMYRSIGNGEVVNPDPESDFDDIFTDVSETSYYRDAIYWGQKYGIVAGTSSTTFEPDRPISRQEAASMIGRAIKRLPVYGFDLYVEDSENPAPNFTDNKAIARWAKEYVEFVRVKGLIYGYEDGSFKPNKLITRAEGTSMLVRLAQKSEIFD